MQVHLECELVFVGCIVLLYDDCPNQPRCGDVFATVLDSGGLGSLLVLRFRPRTEHSFNTLVHARCVKTATSMDPDPP